MAYSPTASASERVLLDGLLATGIKSVTIGRLRRWFRRGLPRMLGPVVYFAQTIERLGPKHTRHALLVVAGAWPESVDQGIVSATFEAWFEKQFGAVADDPETRWKRLYYRMSRAGGLRRRALELARPPRSVMPHDLRSAGFSEKHIDRFFLRDKNGRVRFDGKTFVKAWAAQLPNARRALREADAEARLDALRVGHALAAALGRPEDTPLHALDVLLGQSGGRVLTPPERAARFAGIRLARAVLTA